MTTMDTRAPMELFGAHPGVSVIDPSSVLTRLWYFDGKFLRAEGFRRDQDYVRALVALSNQAVGHGVVHGFDVRRGGGDTFRIEGGLALAPSGRVVHLPRQIDLSVAELIARSVGELDPGSTPSGASADFVRCPPAEPGDTVTGVPPRPLYVLTVAVAEALCGEEERFGQLCEDACATETDRSVAVEGARFRVRQLRLVLPTSRRVPFVNTHLRSRVASAFFAEERTATPSMISGAGLRTDVWCAGAEGVGGEEVALAVFERSAAVTTWLDMWTARRELMEGAPQRYWGWRFAMRPLDVFLAQVLQFQCQLLALGGDGNGAGSDDPCADERSALAEADRVLAAFTDRASHKAAGGMEARRERSAGEATAEEGMSAVTRSLSELRTRISGVLSGGRRPASGSLLVDGGIIELPSGGYLPIDPARSVEAQVRALMGPGVDLRFCAVRPDFIPEALQEAQHMDRISLTAGIDDPGVLEEVDILVPGGAITRKDAGVEAFEGRVRMLPATKQTSHGTELGSALTLAAVARDQVQEGWSWTLAATGEAPHRLAVADLVGAMSVEFGGQRPDGDVPRADLHVEANSVHESAMAEGAFRQRVAREGVMARERYERSMVTLAGNVTGAVPPDRPIPRDAKRPLSLWFDVETDRDLRQVDIGGGVSVRLRISVYSRAATEPLLVDAQVSGSLVVRTKQSYGTGGGNQLVDVVTDVNGVVDPLVIAGAVVRDPPPQAVRDTVLRWRVGVSDRRVRVLSVGVEQAEATARARFEDAGDPRRIHGLFQLLRRGPTTLDTGDWKPLSTDEGEGRDLVRIADLELNESARALDVGAPGRELGESVIEMIGTEIALRGRDPSFTAFARRRLLEAERDDTSAVTTSADWVMFHRRRTKVCGGPTDRPQAIRRFRWFHAVVDEKQQLERFRALAGSWEQVDHDDLTSVRVRDRLDQLGFEPVTTVEFPERRAELQSSRVVLRASWSAAPRGDLLLAAAVAAPITGDGVDVDLRRLMTATSSVGDLIETSSMETSVMRDIPPEFQATGIDGVFFTMGYRRSEAELGHVLLVRTTTKEWVALERAAEEAAELNRDVFASVVGEPDTFVAVLDEANLRNQHDVVTWWGPGETVLHAGRALSAGLAALADPGERVEPWTRALRAALGFQRIIGLDARWTVDENDMVVFLVRPDQ